MIECEKCWVQRTNAAAYRSLKLTLANRMISASGPSKVLPGHILCYISKLTMYYNATLKG